MGKRRANPEYGSEEPGRAPVPLLHVAQHAPAPTAVRRDWDWLSRLLAAQAEGEAGQK